MRRRRDRHPTARTGRGAKPRTSLPGARSERPDRRPLTRRDVVRRLRPRAACSRSARRRSAARRRMRRATFRARRLRSSSKTRRRRTCSFRPRCRSHPPVPGAPSSRSLRPRAISSTAATRSRAFPGIGKPVPARHDGRHVLRDGRGRQHRELGVHDLRGQRRAASGHDAADDRRARQPDRRGDRRQRRHRHLHRTHRHRRRNGPSPSVPPASGASSPSARPPSTAAPRRSRQHAGSSFTSSSATHPPRSPAPT